MALVSVFARLARLESEQVTTKEKIDDIEKRLAGVQSDFSTAIVPGIAGLKQSMAGLQTQLAGVDLPPDAQAALDQAVADADALGVTADNVAAGFVLAPPPGQAA